MYDLPNVNDKIKHLNECLRTLYYNHVPLRKAKPKSKNYPAWFNSEVTMALLERDLAYQRWKITRTNESNLDYKRLRNIFNRICRDAKRSYFNKIFPPKIPQKSTWGNLADLGVVDRTSLKNIFNSDEIN